MTEKSVSMRDSSVKQAGGGTSRRETTLDIIVRIQCRHEVHEPLLLYVSYVVVVS